MMRTTLERFEDKIVRVPIAGCWLWTGAVDSNGYGRFRGERTTVLAHRWAYRAFTGKYPGTSLCHSCDTPACCNPAHMFPGDQMANMHDSKAKGRTNKGEQRPLSVLVEEDVAYIRASRLPQALLAQRFGVHQVTVSKIKRRILWSHIP